MLTGLVDVASPRSWQLGQWLHFICPPIMILNWKDKPIQGKVTPTQVLEAQPLSFVGICFSLQYVRGSSIHWQRKF
jgi:hypothetical protein